MGKWARNQAAKDLSKFKNLTDLPDKIELRQQISLLNKQQRQIFDDFCERVVSKDVNEPPVYLFITGNAGTGKSHLVRLLIEAVKSIKIMPGDDLKKPPLLNMAPTATAAFIIGGKTIDSSLGFTQFTPIDSNQYIPVDQARLSSLKFQYEEASVLFIDEISMVGSKKLTKINFRLQDLADGENKLKFMGGRSVVAIGDLWQLPPVRDKIILDNNSLDGRPDFAPSHFKENFKIFYLTEKMRNQKDETFSTLCDRVGRGKVTEENEIYLKTRIRKSENEGSNEKIKNGEISIIVTTNPKRELLNNQKLDELLPNEKEYLCNSVNRITNLPHGPKLSNRDKDNLSKTGNLPETLRLKVGAPVVITTNNKKAKYREDGMGNGARGYVSAIQVSPENQDKVEIIWVVFKNEKIGRRYRFDHQELREKFNPGHPLATPILPERNRFTVQWGNVQYQRTNFPLSLAYALTSWKCQGDTLDEVIIDFGPDKEHGIKNCIVPGSFYVALTRVRVGANVFLKSFDKSYIMVNHKIEDKIAAIRKFSNYEMKKIYLADRIFVNEDSEFKFGFLNINGLLDGNHADYLNEDKNLLNIDVLVLGETKLEKKIEISLIKQKLDKWHVIGRKDASDNKKHMGLLLLSPKTSTARDKITTIAYKNCERDKDLQIQGVTIRMQKDLYVGFLYCRSTPNNEEIKAIKESFEECKLILGDFNLAMNIPKDKKKIEALCGSQKFPVLEETTRVISYNQLDHILADNALKGKCFATSFFNFISDHKSIVVRLSMTSEFTNKMLEKILFDSELHLKKKHTQKDKTTNDYPEDYVLSEPKDTKKGQKEEKRARVISTKTDVNMQWSRRFKNPDLSTC